MSIYSHSFPRSFTTLWLVFSRMNNFNNHAQAMMIQPECLCMRGTKSSCVLEWNVCSAGQKCTITDSHFPTSVVRGDGSGACADGDIELFAAGQASDQSCALKCKTGYTPNQPGSAIQVSCIPKETSSTTGETTWPSNPCKRTWSWFDGSYIQLMVGVISGMW